MKKNHNEELQKQKDKIKTMEKEKDDMKKQIEILLNKVGDTNITNNTIVLNCYGSEDLSHVSDRFKTELLKIPYEMIPRLIEKIHFNQQKPENKNIYLPNKKEPFIKVYRDSKWVYKDRKETIKDLINTNYNRLEAHYDDKGSKALTVPQKNRYSNFVDQWKENSEICNNIEKKCDILILNSNKKLE